MKKSSIRLNHLFVYGTLRRDFNGKRHPFFSKGCDYLCEARFNGKLYDLGSFPGAVPSDNPSDWVKGEVYRLNQPEATLSVLDAYEGAVGPEPLYRRELVDITLENGKPIEAFTYIFNLPVDGYPRIESGDYVEYIQSFELEKF